MIKTFTLLDALIIIVISVVAIIAFGMFDKFGDDGVIVYRQNTIIAKYPLSQIGQYTVSGLLDSLIFTIDSGGAVEIAHSSCPRQICMRGGAIRPPRGQLVCAPNNILIQIHSRKNRNAHENVDAIAY